MLRISPPEGLFPFRHEAMATDFVFSFGEVEASYAKGAAVEAFRLVDEVEAKLSLYQESSDISRINLADRGQAVTVSSLCVECLELAMEASRLTEERFQVFVGREACAAKGHLPQHLQQKFGNAAERKREEGDYLLLDPGARQVTKLRDDAVVDLGGIGKGFALDYAIQALEDWEVPLASLNAGGSTHLFRGDERLAVWGVELGAVALAPLKIGALASSGLGFQERHIIDPRTGESKTLWRRSYVQAPSAALGDALSTAALLMEWPALEALVQSRPECSFAVETTEGDFRRCGSYFREDRDGLEP